MSCDTLSSFIDINDNTEAPCQLEALSLDMQEIGCVAQAAAASWCQFKTGSELVCDELREAATRLAEGADKMT